MSNFGGTISPFGDSPIRPRRLFSSLSPAPEERGRRANKARRKVPPRILRRNNVAASQIQRAAKAFLARRRARNAVSDRQGIGLPTNLASNKKDTHAPGITSNFAIRNMYSVNMTKIAKADGDHEINKRLRNSVNITGFAIYFIMRGNYGGPTLLNLAVIAPKNSAADPPSVDGFFRDYTFSRDINFTTGLSSNELHTLPINTDKFNVLMHKRMTLTSSGGGFVSRENFVDKKFWVPLHRTINFDDDLGSTLPEHNVFLVFWCDWITAGSGVGVNPDVLTGSIRTVTYFNELSEKPKRFIIG